MQNLTSTPKLKRLITFFLFIFISTLLFKSCRKIDSPESVIQNNSIVEKFFGSHRSSKPIVNSIIGYMRNQNNKNSFVKSLSKSIGFPYWNKSIIFDASGRSGKGLGGDVIVVYVPFIRDSQYYVNSALILRITGEDTSYRYLHDFQYKEFGFAPPSNEDWNAKI